MSLHVAHLAMKSVIEPTDEMRFVFAKIDGGHTDPTKTQSLSERREFMTQLAEVGAIHAHEYTEPHAGRS